MYAFSLRYGESRGYSVKGRFCVGKGLHVGVLRVRRLELVDVTVDEGGGLVEVTRAADEVHEGVRVVLALADGLDACTPRFSDVRRKKQGGGGEKMGGCSTVVCDAGWSWSLVVSTCCPSPTNVDRTGGGGLVVMLAVVKMW